MKDSSPANHYSLLSTIQHNFGLGCLRFTCDTKNVKPLTPLFAVTGSTAIATRPEPELNWPTPTPGAPAEPVSSTKATTSAGGWTVQRTGLLGTGDNSAGAIAGSSASDIWAVGDFLPDTATSNQDATLTFAEHRRGGPDPGVLPGAVHRPRPFPAPHRDLLAGLPDHLTLPLREAAGSGHDRNTYSSEPRPGPVRPVLGGADRAHVRDVHVRPGRVGSV